MNVDHDELNKILEKTLMPENAHLPARKIPPRIEECYPEVVDSQTNKMGGLVQWTSSDKKRYFPASKTYNRIDPGVYDILSAPNIGLFFEKFPVNIEGLLRFPQANSEKIIKEIQAFWEKGNIFAEYNLPHQRGILMWGPPGGGKTCTVKILMKDVVDRGGIVVRFTMPGLFTEGMRILREIESETPVVVLMEDIDSIIENFNESDVLNILDGVNKIERVVYLATTNYPERLGPRIVNRPSRFDKRFKIGYPDPVSRRMYFEYIIGGQEKLDKLKINLDRWVDDTEDFSLAHLKELFTAVVIFGDSYNDAIDTLSKMREGKLDSHDDEFKSPMGFELGLKKKPDYTGMPGYRS
jgi:hypothetical protein